MGFMGLTHIGESDGAFDFMYGVVDGITEKLIAEFPDTTTCYNTSGYINTALVIENLVVPSQEYFVCNEKFMEFVQMNIVKLKEELSDWSDELRPDVERLITSLESIKIEE